MRVHDPKSDPKRLKKLIREREKAKLEGIFAQEAELSVQGPKTLCCPICSKQFKYKKNLRQHMKIHKGEKRFSCSKCAMAFLDSSHLNRHMRTHEAADYQSKRKCHPHSSASDKKAFSSFKNLKEQALVQTGYTTYSCPECGKPFSRLDNMKVHMKIHERKPFRCQECQKSFSNEKGLVKHIADHRKNKLHSCCTCGNAFLNASQLIIHTRIHTGEKPYSCAKCGKSFTQIAHVKQHRKKCICSAKNV
jgi:KRAB domain-containing zinc finger protein